MDILSKKCPTKTRMANTAPEAAIGFRKWLIKYRSISFIQIAEICSCFHRKVQDIRGFLDHGFRVQTAGIMFRCAQVMGRSHRGMPDFGARPEEKGERRHPERRGQMHHPSVRTDEKIKFPQ